MGKDLRPARTSLAVVTTTAFRARLAHYVGRVRHGGDFIAIRRKGEESVYLISQADWDLLDVRIADIEDGPFDPVIERRRGGIMKWFRRQREEAQLRARIKARAAAREEIAGEWRKG